MRGIDSGRAAVLVRAGISGLNGLAALTPATVVKRFNAALEQNPRPGVKTFTTKEATAFVRAAQAFAGVKAKAKVAASKAGST